MSELEPNSVKTTKQCIEAATVDAYGEYEQVCGWLTCFEEVFDKVNRILLFGEEVKLVGFEVRNDVEVVAVCLKNKKKAWVSLNSIELIKPSKSQRLWLKAYAEWSH
jgi:hypothetical protein